MKRFEMAIFLDRPATSHLEEIRDLKLKTKLTGVSKEVIKFFCSYLIIQILFSFEMFQILFTILLHISGNQARRAKNCNNTVRLLKKNLATGYKFENMRLLGLRYYYARAFGIIQKLITLNFLRYANIVFSYFYNKNL